MKRLEIIHARMSVKPSGEILEALHSTEIPRDSNINMEVFINETLGTDLSIHLHHRDAGKTRLPSPLGISLADALKTYGMVEHTVWTETGKQLQK